MNASVFKEIRDLGIDVIRIPDLATTRTVAAAYSRFPMVEYAEPDALMPLADTSLVTPNDPLLGNQWHHVNIESQNAWAVATGLPMPITRITVCDTGVSSTHPDLQAYLRTDLGYNTADNAPGHWEPVHWHGTAVAGSAAAIGNNALGVAGVSWGSEIVPVRVTNLLSGSAYISDMADCINYGANVGSDVINLSYQTYSGGAISSTIIAAADYADSLGSVVVIAAGNENSNPAPNQDPRIHRLCGRHHLDEREGLVLELRQLCRHRGPGGIDHHHLCDRELLRCQPQRPGRSRGVRSKQ